MIPLHQPYITGNEIKFIEKAIHTNQLSGNGEFTKKCHTYFEEKFGFSKCLLTTSCTAALEMAALLINLQEGDEIIIPSYTFVSSVNPFIMRGAKIVFIDSQKDSPNLDHTQLPHLITSKTKAIVVVHYAGIGCDMESIMKLAHLHDLYVIEDGAHAQDAYYNDIPLGGIGHLSTFSFHATKNITAGEAGLLVINDESLHKRAEILWEKGTNRKTFLEGNVNKYEWLDIGSSFYPSEITAAFLFAQLQESDFILEKRLKIWHSYFNAFEEIEGIETPFIPQKTKHNAHLFYLKTANIDDRNKLIAALKKRKINAAFHYLALDQSPFWLEKQSLALPNAKQWEECLIRLPLYVSLSKAEIDKIINAVIEIQTS